VSAISVIVPTAATQDRAASLTRALESALGQEGVRPDVIVVANGPGCDPDVLATLARRRDIRLIRRHEAGLGPSISTGRDLVNAPFFAELDDDDLLLPGALATRLERMRAQPTVDAVVTTGFLRAGERDSLNLPDLTRCAADPLRSLMDTMWLPPCAGLFRTATIPTEYFRAMPAYLEWTYLAMVLALERRIAFVATPTFVYNEDTPGSLSKSREYALRQPEAIKTLLRLPVPPDVRRRLRQKYVAALHGASVTGLSLGRTSLAWRLHLQTVLYPRGWRYLSYTRHLFA
jgi:glycosyltransferase involved in cell wall biosynthesis